MRARYVVLLAALLVVAKVAHDIARRSSGEPVAVAAFNGLTSFIRGRPQELIDPNYYRAQADSFLRQFHQSDPRLPRYDLYIDPTELHRLEMPFEDDQDTQNLRASWNRWYPLGQRKTAVAVLKQNETLYPVHMRVRGTGSNHFLGPAKSWRITRIPLPPEEGWQKPWDLPSDVVNLTLPEHYLIEWLAFEMAERAGMITPFVEPAVLYINDVYQGIRQAGGQTGPSFMRRQGLPIGYFIDARNDRWDQEDQPPPDVLYDYRFGDRRMGGDYRDDVELRLTDQQIIDMFVFYLLYRPAHMVDLRFYVDPLFRFVTLVPWNLEIPRANPRYYATTPPVNRRTFDVSVTNFEDLGSVNYLFRDLIYPRVTPQIVYEILAKLYALTQAGAPLSLAVIKEDYQAMEQRFAGELDAFPYWYGSRDFDFIKDTRQVAQDLKTNVLFQALDQSYEQLGQELDTFSANCAFSPNRIAGSVRGRLTCGSGAGLGATMMSLKMTGSAPQSWSLVLDRNKNNRIDQGDALIPVGAEGRFQLDQDGFHVFYDGRELVSFYESGRLNLYDFFLVGPSALGRPDAVGFRRPFGEDLREVTVSLEAPGDFAQDLSPALLPLWQPTAEPADGEFEVHDLPNFIQEKGDNKFLIPSGHHRLTSPTVLPLGASLEIAPGTKVSFDGGTYLYLSGPLKAVGDANAPIEFLSSDPTDPGGGVIINTTAGSPSTLGFCHFQGLAGSQINKVDYGGALTVLGGRIQIENCSFDKIPAASAVELRWAEGRLSKLTIKRTKGRGVYLESSATSVQDLSVSNALGDGLYLQDSNVRVSGAAFSSRGSDAIVAKRRSLASLSGVTINGARKGLRISDDSQVTFTESRVARSATAVHVHWEETNRNGMSVTLAAVEFDDNGQDILQDPGT
ncbi:MAG: right-handed parallel beta-helix repeat-containing protein, partial [Pseudomonadota bacterium]